jgi:hypothetical protein
MILTPGLARSIVENIPGVKPVLSTRGDSKGEHVKYNYRFEFPGSPVRHIAITRKSTKEGVTVYVNQQSVKNVSFSNLVVKAVRVSEKYPKGYKGKTGDKGLSSSAANLSSLNPKNNDVLRLSIATKEGLQQLLDWYLDKEIVVVTEANETVTDKMITELSNHLTTITSSVPAFSPSDEVGFKSDTKNLTTDEREAVVKVRFGQGTFREALLSIAGEKCWMTGLEGKRLLIASHIKPWSHCSEEVVSRGQSDNGLLLSALWDSAFDAGLISFDENWDVITSFALSESAKTTLNIKQYSNLPEVFRNDRRSSYLTYHRINVFENDIK